MKKFEIKELKKALNNLEIVIGDLDAVLYTSGHENALQVIKPKIEDAFHAIEDGDIKYCKKLLSQVLELLN